MRAWIRRLWQLSSAAVVIVCTACTETPKQRTMTVTVAATGSSNLDAFRASRINVYVNDFGQLGFYGAQNALLGAPQKSENRVLFFGDSITENWDISKSFQGKPYINRGIGGQTTSQMLVRFRQDVIDLKPKVVVILAGTNDIGGNTGPISNESIERNLLDFAELGKLHNIRVILASILPVNNYSPSARESFAVRPMDRILSLNKWLKKYCAAEGLIYLDYFSAVVDESGYLKRELADDGLHPNEAGYKVMTLLADNAIEQALNPAFQNGGAANCDAPSSRETKKFCAPENSRSR